jgi:uncharacterized protein (DUF2336 family)
MIVKRFLLWARLASAEQRAEAVAALAGAYLYSDLSPEDRWEAEAALIGMLDDPSPLVRRAMAEAMASALDAPHPLIIGLANDQGDIAAFVLARSPVLSDADLVDCAAIGDTTAQSAIAGRAELSASVCAALAEIGQPEALVILARNLSAEIPDFSLRRMTERHGTDGAVREALLARPHLPVDIHQDLVAAVSDALSGFVLNCGWLSPERTARLVRDTRERAAITIAAGTNEGLPALVARLRENRQLTPGFILRALLSRQLALVEAAFAEITGLPEKKVAAFLHDRRGAGFAALYRRAGLPQPLLPAFVAALAACHESTQDTGAVLSRRMVERVISACENLEGSEAASLVALLRRFEMEAAREEARMVTDRLADEAALALIVESDPDALVIDPDDRPLLVAA